MHNSEGSCYWAHLLSVKIICNCQYFFWQKLKFILKRNAYFFLLDAGELWKHRPLVDINLFLAVLRMYCMHFQTQCFSADDSQMSSFWMCRLKYHLWTDYSASWYFDYFKCSSLWVIAFKISQFRDKINYYGVQITSLIPI